MDPDGMVLEEKVEEDERVNVCEEVTNDEQILPNRTVCWADLPEEVVLTALANFSIYDIGKFRTVSRAWNSAIGRFSLAPCCLVSTAHNVRIFDTGARKWYDWETFPARLLDHEPEIQRLFLNPHTVSRMSIQAEGPERVLSAAGSLVLLKNELGSQWIVLNPLNKSFQRVPPAPEMDGHGREIPFKRTELLVSNNASTWKDLEMRPSSTIISWGLDGRLLATFDFKTGTWDVNHQLEHGLSHLMSGKPVLVEERFLYYLSPSPVRDRTVHALCGDSYDLALYDLQTKKSEVLTVASMAELNPLLFACLFESRGRIMLLGGKGGAPYSYWSASRLEIGVFVWQLCPDKGSWVEVGCMPKNLVNKMFCEKWRIRPLHCATSGDCIGMLQDMQDEAESKLFFFDLFAKAWSLIPAEIYEYAFRDSKNLFMFQPKMNVMA